MAASTFALMPQDRQSALRGEFVYRDVEKG